jgi:hypothetical protein
LTNVKWWAPKGSGDKDEIEEELNRPGTAYLEFNAELGKPEMQQNPQLPNELYKNKSDKIAEIEKVLGLYAMQQGDASVAPPTYKGTVALDEYGQRRIKSRRDDIEGAINVLARVAVRMIQKVYTEPRVYRLVQANNLPSEKIAINQPIYTDFTNQIKRINDITVGEYDVITVSGSTLPSNRWAVAEYYESIYEKGIIDQQEFLMKTEVADVEGVLARFGQMNRMERHIAQLEEEVKKHKGDLQTADREIVHLRQSLEVEKFKSSIAAPKAAIEASKRLYETRNADELAIQRREWQVEKKLLNQKNEVKK